MGYEPMPYKIGKRLGIIDNLEPQILLPLSIYRSIYDIMAKNIKIDELNGNMYSNEKCSKIEDLIDPIELVVGNSILAIFPKGYLK